MTVQWIAPSEKDAASATLEKRLWDAADQFRANSGLKAQEYPGPILGLFFLRFAEVRFAIQRSKLKAAGASSSEFSRRSSRVDEPVAYHAESILYLSPEARFDYLLTLPEVADIGAKVNAAMRDIEKLNPQLAGVLPKTFNLFTSTLLKELLKKVSEIPATADYDAFGRIYEYFLGEFARTEGQKGGEFYTPSGIVRLLAEVIEPFYGRILDPACGSGGMFVQSARFVAEHRRNPAAELAIFGVEKTDETGRLCRLNLAVHGLEGDIKHGGNINSYYDDPHAATGSFDFVLANPPFNVNAVDKERLKDMVGHDSRGKPSPLPLRPAAHRQRQLPVDSALLLGAERHRPRRLRHGQLGLRCPLQRAGTAAEADRSAGGGCDGRRRLQHVLHRHAALHAVVLRQGQGPDKARRHGALHRCPPHLPAGGSRPPRMDTGADRFHRQPCPPLSRRGARHHRRR
ncbi:hypothetical protein ACCAA_350006 [Candidatus Accumulibacter aalborgensis]|uniref:site-specific DNA-methyltransferase (adenine-specific) n=1 Tax=Candidatus Accumulibacter aalborgensis TaxID=1860102 RepID=A0A1A8XRH9_9PROT|nr:hypothetical protein ACCAA_350006 [Candidatus Accumulibacter aalborgensis]